MPQSRFLIELGYELKQARINKRFTQDDVAHRLGVTRSAIANYERGARSVEIEFYCKLCELYDIDPEIIFNKIRKYMYK